MIYTVCRRYKTKINRLLFLVQIPEIPGRDKLYLIDCIVQLRQHPAYGNYHSPRVYFAPFRSFLIR